MSDRAVAIGMDQVRRDVEELRRRVGRLPVLFGHGGGAGMGILVVATKDDLPEVPAPRLAYTTDTGHLYVRGKDPGGSTVWIPISHLEEDEG